MVQRGAIKASLFGLMILVLTLGGGGSASAQKPASDPALDSLVYHAIVAESAAAAAEEVQRTTDRYWAVASAAVLVIAGLLGFFGYRQLADVRARATSDVAAIRENATREIEQRIRTYVDSEDFWRINQRLFDRVTSEKLRSEVAKFEHQEEVLILQGLTKKLETTPGEFTQNDIENFYTYFTRHAADANVLRLPYFVSAFNALLVRCYKQQDYRRVRNVEAIFGDRLQEEAASAAIHQLIRIYAMLVLGERSNLGADKDRVVAYCLVLRSRNELNFSAAFYLPYLLHFAQSDQTPTIESWLRDIGNMQGQEIASFIKMLDEFGDPRRLGTPPQPHHFRLSEKLAAFAAKYKPAIDVLRARTLEQQPDGARQTSPEATGTATAEAPKPAETANPA